MFGISKEEAMKMIKSEVDDLRTEINAKMRKIDVPPSARELAQQALRELVSLIDPKEFLNNLLATKGVTLEDLVRQAVQKELRAEEYAPGKEEILERVAEAVTEQIEEEIDWDKLYEAIGAKAAARLPKDEIVEQASERLADQAWEEIDLDELYPVIGEKIVDRFQKKT